MTPNSTFVLQMFLPCKTNTISLLMTEAYFYHWDYNLIILNPLPRPTYVTLCKISCLQWGVRKMLGAENRTFSGLFMKLCPEGDGNVLDG